MIEGKTFVQIKNPRTNKYVKIDRTTGSIISHKKTSKPYKNIPIAKRGEL